MESGDEAGAKALGNSGPRVKFTIPAGIELEIYTLTKC